MSSSQNSNMSAPLYDVAVREEAPFVMVERDSAGKVSYSGYAIELLEMVAQKVHFRPMITLTNHASYGYLDQDGKWKGLISELVDLKADLAVGPIPITSQQGLMSKVDFTKPFMTSGMSLLIKAPPATTRGINLMLEPFAAEVWVMVCLAFIVVSLALFLIGRFSPYEWARVTKDKDPRLARNSFGLKNSFLFAASTLSWQGYREAPRSISGRILMCMWFMFCACVIVAYAASLCAILTTRGKSTPHHLPFTDYEDIVNRKQVKLGAMKYGHVYSTLKGSHANLMSRMYTYIDESQEWIQSMEEGIQRVKDSGGKYALLMETAKADYVTGTNCDLINYGNSLSSFGYGFAAPQGSPLMDRIGLILLELRENGVLHQLQKKYFIDKYECPKYDTSKLMPHNDDISPDNIASSLDMRDMAIPFLFLFLGVLGAGGALGAELFYRHRLLKKKDPDNTARQPLNTESGILKAPKTSPPPPPIYKVNNKLQEADKQKKGATPECTIPDEKNVEKSGNSIEMVPMDDKAEADKNEEDKGKDGSEFVEVEISKDDKDDKPEPEDKADVINEIA